MRTMAALHTVTPTPIGDITVVRDRAAIIGLYFPGHWYLPQRSVFGDRSADGFDDAITQLGQYFAGIRRTFDLTLAAKGDAFQRAVWALIDEIPYGETATYGELSQRLGGDATPQLVGAAVGRNPLSILVPCHRVVGARGKLTGYAGGLDRKKALLDLEAAVIGPRGTLF